MTVLVALDHVSLKDVVTVQRDAAEVGESTIHLRAGERLSVRDLVEAALIQSANDAADALADYVAHGDTHDFVALMNERARELGLRHTHFTRPDGLDAPGHLSSARDVERLAEIAMHNRVVRAIVRKRTATISGGRRLYTWNDLLGHFPGLIGVKTGHTAAAGWSEVAAARGPGFTIYTVVLGSPSRAQRNADLARLLAWGLAQYRLAPVVARNHMYARIGVGYGRRPLDLVTTRPLRRPVRLGRPLVERIVVPADATLPVRRGQRIGEVRVFAGRRLVGMRPLVAARSVARPGLTGRVGWYAGRTVHHLWSWIT